MRKYKVLPVLVLLFCCKHKESGQISKTSATPYTDTLFGSYRNIRLPFLVSDTTLNLLPDTSTITYEAFEKLVPDTTLIVPFGKDRKLSFYPIGKFAQKGKETYFITHVKGKDKSAVYLGVYDKNRFQASMPLVIENDDNIVHSASIDKRLTIVLNNEWIDKNVLYYNRTIYAYNNVGTFTKVLTETNVERNAETAVANPLDTFARKYKYSGDYIKGPKNFLTIRDGVKPDTYRLFIHFETGDNEDECKGELKGEFKMTSEKNGVFTGKGDPCVLNFNFAGNEVRVKETGSCGNYRGIKCFFNDTYVKKKQTKTNRDTKKK